LPYCFVLLKNCPKFNEIVAFLERKHKAKLKIEWKPMRFSVAGRCSLFRRHIILNPELADLETLVHEVGHRLERLPYALVYSAIINTVIMMTIVILFKSTTVSLLGTAINLLICALTAFLKHRPTDRFVYEGVTEILEKVCGDCCYKL